MYYDSTPHMIIGSIEEPRKAMPCKTFIKASSPVTVRDEPAEEKVDDEGDVFQSLKATDWQPCYSGGLLQLVHN